MVSRGAFLWAWVLACMLLVLASSPPGEAQESRDPGLDWRTLETAHFRIHYPSELESVARLAAEISEEVHERLSKELDWEPRERTEVLLVDDFDRPNGFARPIPYNMMGLFVVPPEPGGFIQVDGLEQWLEELIVHEYVHILHLDRVRGGPEGLRSVFGRQPFAMPNVFNPTWLVEGLATHFESDHYHGPGRGKDSEFRMMMQAEVESGLRPLSQVNIPNVRWPAGRVPYLYGTYFFRFLEETRGQESIEHFLRIYSGQLIPFRLNSTAQEAFGGGFPELWEEFQEWLEALFAGKAKARWEAGIEEGQAVTDPGDVGRHDGGNLDVDDQGRVYFVRDDGYSQPRLVRKAEGESPEVLAEVNFGARIRVHSEAGILIAQPQICREYRTYYDLYHLSLDGGSKRRLTHCARYRDAAWHPDGDRIAAVRFEAGKSDLDLLDREGELLRNLVEGGEEKLISQPDFSPNGEELVVARSERGQAADLYLLDWREEEWQRLTDEPKALSHPRFSPDGQSILFTADHGGWFDVHALDLEDEHLEGEDIHMQALTRAGTGAFQGVINPVDGSLDFLLYGPEGYQLRRRDSAEPVGSTPVAEAGREPEPAREGVTEASRSYSSLESLAPTSWLPYLRVESDLVEAGATVFGEDVRSVHRYQLTPVIDFTHQDPVGSANYSWADRLFVSYGADNRPDRDEEDELLRVRRVERGSFSYQVPFSRQERRWSLVAGLVHDRERERSREDDVVPIASEQDDVYGLALLMDDTRGARKAISRQEGRQIRILQERHSRGGDFRGEALVADWREYLHLGGSHVLALRGVRGEGRDQARRFQLGGTQGEGFAGLEFAPAPTGLFNRRGYALRGYPEGREALRGRRMELGTAEYRFPLGRVERTAMAPPIGLRQWSGALFGSAGRAWDDDSGSRDWRRSIGAEAILDLNFGYQLLPVRARIGVARGLDEEAGGGTEAYLRLGAAF